MSKDGCFSNMDSSKIKDNERSENFQKITNIIESHDIILFMKGNKEFPACGFSGVVVKILNLLNVQFETYDILHDENIRHYLKEYSDWPTFPQLYIKKELIGGCDIVKELFLSEELYRILEEKNIQHTKIDLAPYKNQQ